MKDIAQTVAQVLVQVGATPAAIHPRARLQAELGLDSIDLTEAALLLEDAFGVALSDRELRRLSTVEELISYPRRQVGEATAQPALPIPMLHHIPF